MPTHRRTNARLHRLAKIVRAVEIIDAHGCATPEDAARVLSESWHGHGVDFRPLIDVLPDVWHLILAIIEAVSDNEIASILLQILGFILAKGQS